jgi:type I restriction enzyme S subunit
MDGDFHINHWYSDDAYLVQRSCRIKSKNINFQGYLSKAIVAPVKFYESILQGATVGHLGAKHLNGMDILMPPETFDLSVFNKIMSNKLKLASANNKLKQSRDRLLTRLMSGKIDVENLDIEFPASMKEEVPDA